MHFTPLFSSENKTEFHLVTMCLFINYSARSIPIETDKSTKSTLPLTDINVLKCRSPLRYVGSNTILVWSFLPNGKNWNHKITVLVLCVIFLKYLKYFIILQHSGTTKYWCCNVETTPGRPQVDRVRNWWWREGVLDGDYVYVWILPDKTTTLKYVLVWGFPRLLFTNSSDFSLWVLTFWQGIFRVFRLNNSLNHRDCAGTLH